MNEKEFFKDLDNMSLREVVEKTKYMTLSEGGMLLLIEKIVREIEELKKHK